MARSNARSKEDRIMEIDQKIATHQIAINTLERKKQSLQVQTVNLKVSSEIAELLETNGLTIEDLVNEKMIKKAMTSKQKSEI